MERIRQNSLRKTLESGEVALGLLDNTYSPTLVEFYGELGLDFVWIDFEHGGPSPWDGERLAGLLRAAELVDTELLVRLPSTEPGLIRKALDIGARNLFLSRVTTVAEVENAVSATQFRYRNAAGERGLANPRAARWGLAENYVGSEDTETVLGVTIETREAVECIDDILSIPELGFVFAGPLDLSVAYGHPGELDHEDVTEAVETIRAAAIEAGVPLGGLGFGMDDVNEKAKTGYQLINIGSTTGALQGAVEGMLGDYEKPA